MRHDARGGEPAAGQAGSGGGRDSNDGAEEVTRGPVVARARPVHRCCASARSTRQTRSNVSAMYRSTSAIQLRTAFHADGEQHREHGEDRQRVGVQPRREQRPAALGEPLRVVLHEEPERGGAERREPQPRRQLQPQRRRPVAALPDRRAGTPRRRSPPRVRGRAARRPRRARARRAAGRRRAGTGSRTSSASRAARPGTRWSRRWVMLRPVSSATSVEQPEDGKPGPPPT